MTLATIFADFADHLRSDEFLQSARHGAHPTAFTRCRKLPLSSLIAVLLTGMRMSVQAELDTFFAHLRQQAQLMRHVSAQAFAQARAKVEMTALPQLNDWLIARAERDGLVPRWQGLRLVAADATTVRFGLRVSHVGRAAATNQIAFGLFLPGAELMLAASLHGVHEHGERQMLFEHLYRLGSTDLLLLDRGYPCRWLVATLNQRGIPFCMRVDSTGFACVRDFLRAGLDDQVVTLRAPDQHDARDYECHRQPHAVRLVRTVVGNGRVYVLMTNLLDTARFPVVGFGALYHRRWRIEEAFKRLKHRLNLEHVSGLSQHAVMQDVAAKILTDNLEALAVQAAHDLAKLPIDQRINRAYTHTLMKPLLPALLAGKRLGTLLKKALALIAREVSLHRENLSKPRKSRPKPHKFMTQKQC